MDGDGVDGVEVNKVEVEEICANRRVEGEYWSSNEIELQERWIGPRVENLGREKRLSVKNKRKRKAL